MKTHNCRVCGKKINELMSFGKMPIANAFLKNQKESQFLFQLKIGFCEICFTFQVLNVQMLKKCLMKIMLI